MGALCLARLLVAIVPLRYWRRSLGPTGQRREDAAASVFLASRIERAAIRLPFATKCLPRAMALSWMLRRYRLDHALVLAVRGARERGAADALHAWVETGGRIILGDEPGPWHVIYRL